MTVAVSDHPSSVTHHPAPRRPDAAALARLGNLHLAARLVVDGLFSGQHKSPRKGFSVEFAEHRQYTPGDDPRHLDWKILAKRDKLYVKQYEEQTNLRGYVVVDVSASMNYHHSGAVTKLDYACLCAAALCYLMQQQHDAFGLILFADDVRTFIPPRQGKAHLHTVLDALQQVEPAGRTDVSRVFNDLAERMNRRALVMVLSDLLGDRADAPELVDAIGHFRHRKHEVMVMQVLDRAEIDFPFKDANQLQDMETGRTVAADAQAIRDHYLDQLGRFITTLQRGCTQREVGYALADTTQPFDLFLMEFLTRRHRMHAAKAMA
jgi:uncharacterized protein (DUF58 family)